MKIEVGNTRALLVVAMAGSPIKPNEAGSRGQNVLLPTMTGRDVEARITNTIDLGGVGNLWRRDDYIVNFFVLKLI